MEARLIISHITSSYLINQPTDIIPFVYCPLVRTLVILVFGIAHIGIVILGVLYVLSPVIMHN